MILLSKPRVLQPSRFQLNKSNPLTRGLIYLYVGSEGYRAHRGLGLVIDERLTIGGTGVTRRPTQAGDGLYFDGTQPTNAAGHGVVDWFANLTQQTVGFYGVISGSAGAPLVQQWGGDSSLQGFDLETGSSNEIVFANQQEGGDSGSIGIWISANNVFRRDVPTAVIGSWPGGPISTIATSEGYLASLNTITGYPVHINNSLSSNFQFGRNEGSGVLIGGVSLVPIWNRALSNNELQSWTQNPWQIFAPQQRRILVGVGGLATYTLTADKGDYSLSGQTAGFLYNRVLSATQGSYALNGQIVNVNYGRVVSAGQGSYSLTGQSVNMLLGKGLTADFGTYNITGQTTGVLYNRKLTADQGSFALNGQTATLTYATVTAYTLSASSGSYAISGQPATLTYSGGQVTIKAGSWIRYRTIT